jgi:hypothetical protein
MTTFIEGSTVTLAEIARVVGQSEAETEAEATRLGIYVGIDLRCPSRMRKGSHEGASPCRAAPAAAGATNPITSCPAYRPVGAATRVSVERNKNHGCYRSADDVSTRLWR